MTKIDPEQEKQRLTQRYSAMSDLQLVRVGKDPDALTEWARKALSEEMAKRGIEWKPAPRTAKAVKEGEILVELGVYENRGAASLVHETLTKIGLNAFFHEKAQQDAYGVVTTDGSNGTQLLVRAKDLAAAKAQLNVGAEVSDALAPEENEMSVEKGPVILRRYRDMPAAFVEKSALENAGIECFLQDDNVIRMDWLWSNAMGGIKLLVKEKDAAEAEKLLRELARAIDGAGEDR